MADRSSGADVALHKTARVRSAASLGYVPPFGIHRPSFGPVMYWSSGAVTDILKIKPEPKPAKKKPKAKKRVIKRGA